MMFLTNILCAFKHLWPKQCFHFAGEKVQVFKKFELMSQATHHNACHTFT